MLHKHHLSLNNYIHCIGDIDGLLSHNTCHRPCLLVECPGMDLFIFFPLDEICSPILTIINGVHQLTCYRSCYTVSWLLCLLRCVVPGVWLSSSYICMYDLPRLYTWKVCSTWYTDWDHLLRFRDNYNIMKCYYHIQQAPPHPCISWCILWCIYWTYTVLGIPNLPTSCEYLCKA